MHGNSQNPIITGDCANSVQRHPLHTVRNAPTVHLTTAPQPCAQLLTNAPQTRARGDMRVTERYGCPNTTQPSQNNIAALSESLRRSMGWNALFWNEALTTKPITRSFNPSATDTLRRSTSQKDVSGFPARRNTRRPKPRLDCAVFPIPAPKRLELWVRADGAAQAGRPLVGDTGNSVRPAHQISSLVCRVFKTYEETCHV